MKDTVQKMTVDKRKLKKNWKQFTEKLMNAVCCEVQHQYNVLTMEKQI